MSRFLSITNFDELKMVPEGQIHVQQAPFTAVSSMFLCEDIYVEVSHCLENTTQNIWKFSLTQLMKVITESSYCTAFQM